MPEDQIHELVTESLAAVGLKVLIELLNISSQDKVIQFLNSHTFGLI